MPQFESRDDHVTFSVKFDDQVTECARYVKNWQVGSVMCRGRNMGSWYVTVSILCPQFWKKIDLCRATFLLLFYVKILFLFCYLKILESWSPPIFYLIIWLLYILCSNFCCHSPIFSVFPDNIFIGILPLFVYFNSILVCLRKLNYKKLCFFF